MSVELTIETVEETIVLELQDHVPAVLTIDNIPELRDELDSKVDKEDGDVVLRQDLANPDRGAELVGYAGGNVSEALDKRTIFVGSVVELRGLVVAVGQKVSTLGYYYPGDGGGNEYVIVAGGTGTDDGGSFIDLYNGMQAKGIFDGAIDVRKFGAKGDGVADDTEALRAFLMAGGGDLQATTSFYRVTGTLTMPSDCTLRGRGGVPRIKLDAGSNATVLTAAGQSSIVIENVDIDGTEAGQTASLHYGILLDNCTRITLRNIIAHDTVYPPIRLKGCTDISAKVLTCRRSPADGLKVTNCHRGTFEDIVVDQVPYSGAHANIGAPACVQVDDGSGGLTFVRVTADGGNALNSSGFDVSTHPGEPPTHDITINGLTANRCSTVGFSVSSGSYGIRLSSYTSVDNRQGVSLKGCSGVRVRGFEILTTDDYTPTATPYPVGIGTTTSDCSFESGVIDSVGRLYLDATVTQASRLTFRDVSFKSQDGGVMWLRGVGSPWVGSIAFDSCSFEAAGTPQPIDIGGGAYEYTELKVRFSKCRFKENPLSSLAYTLITWVGDMLFEDCDWSLGVKSGISARANVQSGLTIRGGSFTGGGTAIALNGGQSVVRVSGVKFDGLQYVLHLASPTEVMKIHDVTVSECSFRNTSSAVFRAIGTDKRVDRLTLMGNTHQNNAALFAGFPLGVSGTNLVSANNNPEIVFPV